MDIENNEEDSSKTNETQLKIRTLETDILDFTSELPYWAQYLSEKILSGDSVSEADYQVAYGFLLEDSGLLEKTERPQISIICKSNSGLYKNDLQLLKLFGVEGINALVSDQTLEFCPNLTIIYGSNGSGKSGYIRLLNNVFITKGDKTILPNVHESTVLDKKAKFNFLSNEQNYVLDYPGDCSNSEFKQFSVFDEKAVHAHLDLKNQFEFRPSGLSFFAELIEGYKRLEELIHEDIGQHSKFPDVSVFFDGDSEIKNIITQLSSKSKIEHFKSYIPFTTDDKDGRIILEEKKARLIALKKDKEIQDLGHYKSLLVNLKASFNNVNRYFTNDQITKAGEKINDCIAKEQLAANNNIDQFKSNLIKDVGGLEWKNFIIAADNFARLQQENTSYPQQTDICLLCQQPLSPEAITLISAYWSFIKSKAEQDSKEAQNALDQSKTMLHNLELNLLPDSNILHKWLLENKSSELKTIVELLQNQVKLRGALIAALNTKTISYLKEVQLDTTILDDIINDLDQRILSLQKSDVSKDILELQQRITFFNHKEKLNDHISTIQTTISEMDWVSKAQKAKSKIAKRDITNKEKELSGMYFNQAYIDKFNEECIKLNGDFGISINHTASAGTSYRQLFIKGKQPSEVLSEGEQKVISLADFLSETILSGVNRGIIFDDPVNSLDEKRKGKISERLIEESLSRQVIVFTHDLVFVSQLITSCEDGGKKHLCHWIEKRDGKPGYISLENAPSYEKEYRNNNIPLNHYQSAKKIDCTAKDRESHIRDGFTSLRTCYEVLVINGLFKNVVQRFNERVSVDTLKNVNFDVTVRDEISTGFYNCCKYMEGHSHSDGYPYQKPELDNLNEEIQRYNAIRAKVTAKPSK
ncbi:AAA family ATPase [Mucilaginibacter flavidus]|uniref:AAA family ATPase n=1 Tax=Mucilaginibacter flavidus TaxID=2949309 RepID=UPI002092E26C|nr:hypothetical protein [Mucilaginibacter flavidus]MCO5945285.1 hypothetical protein [Mucilaginibacter flavidus]